MSRSAAAEGPDEPFCSPGQSEVSRSAASEGPKSMAVVGLGDASGSLSAPMGLQMSRSAAPEDLR